MSERNSPSYKPQTVDRMTRVNELLKREIADVLEERGFNDGAFLISVTRVECSTTLKNADVYISLLGASEEQAADVVRQLARKKAELQSRIAKHVVLKYTPVLRFVIDRNIAEGDRVLATLRALEEEDNRNANENQ